MRLTPSWLRSSSDTPPDECSEDGEARSRPEVVIYHDLSDDSTQRDADPDTRADELLPDTDAALLTVLERMHLPATVDEITDRLIGSSKASIDTWAIVHERLHRRRLPALDAAGEIEFDDAQGVVDRPASYASEEGQFPLAVIGAISAIALLVVLALVSASVVTALTMLPVAAAVL